MTSKFLGGAISAVGVIGAAWLLATPTKENDKDNVGTTLTKKTTRIEQLEKDISKLRKELEDSRRKSEAIEVVALSKQILQQRILLLENEKQLLAQKVADLESKVKELEVELASRDQLIKELSGNKQTMESTENNEQ